MHTNDKNSSYGEPEYWRFDYPFKLLQTAFWLWSMAGFQRMPTQDEVMAYDQRYIDDMKLIYNIYSHQGNQSYVMRLYEQHEQFNSNPKLFRQQQQLAQSRTVANNDGAYVEVSSGSSTYVTRKR